jgi:uncharacterized protein (DUF4415 family)
MTKGCENPPKAEVSPGRSKLRSPKSSSIRIDEDVLSYFKRVGEDWQTHINDVLRAVVIGSMVAKTVKAKPRTRTTAKKELAGKRA